MKKWEYRLVSEPPRSNMIEAILHNLGKEGWELVSSYFIPEDPTTSHKSDRINFIFKRPK